jgi:protein HEXIM1/2
MQPHLNRTFCKPGGTEKDEHGSHGIYQGNRKVRLQKKLLFIIERFLIFFFLLIRMDLMKEDDAGGGRVGGQDDSLSTSKRMSTKRKSNEMISHTGIKKAKKHWKAKKWSKNPPPAPVNASNGVKPHGHRRGKNKSKKSKCNDEVKESTTAVAAATATGKSSSKSGRKRRVTGTNHAPFNSTQFLMNDQVSDTITHLNSTLNVKHTEVEDDASLDSIALERPVRRMTRARESSFSIDSDEDYYYSSPEDEEEFVSKEFIKDYDSVRTDRLIDMNKSELINEYLQMEGRIETLEKRLSTSENSTKPEPSSSSEDTEMAETIRGYQKEIQRLESENDQLKLTTRASCSSCSNSCCSSSSSDSDSSSSDSESEHGEEEDAQVNLDKLDVKKKKLIKEDSAQDDTGYESSQSGVKPKNASNGSMIAPNVEKEVVIVVQDAAAVETIEDRCPDLISVNFITSTSP